MKAPWEKAYDSVKDRRYGNLFFAGLAVSLGLAGLVVMSHGAADAEGAQKFVLSMLAGASLLLAVLIAWAVLRARRRRGGRFRSAPLSRDEMLKARSKLRNGMRIVQPPAPRAPDTDLRY